MNKKIKTPVAKKIVKKTNKKIDVDVEIYNIENEAQPEPYTAVDLYGLFFVACAVIAFLYLMSN